MADDKVVIGSNGGTPVKPGDLTRITSVSKVDLSENDPDATAAIPRTSFNTNTANTANDAAETATVKRQEMKAKLEEDKPKKATIKLKPVVVEGVETVTVPLPTQAPRIVTTTTAAPAPVTSQATAVPKFASTDQEDETVKIQKPRSVNASSAVPGVKQTIKLRPSSTTPAPISGSESNAAIIPQAPPPPAAPQAPQPPPVAGGSEAKRTIRLVPKKSDATSGSDQVLATAKPSAPTVKLEEPPAPVPTPVPAEPVRSAVTVKLPSTDSGADAAAPKRTLKLKSSRAPEVSVAPSAPPPMAQPAATIPNSPVAAASATDSEIPAIAAAHGIPLEKGQQYSTAGKQEPSIIFTIAACVAFFVMAYFTWMLVGQYCNNYMDSKIAVPGLSGKVK
ncbi:MAG: hypothetical protein WCI45_12210 [Desulfuromonadales bacterium]